jgi:hypothetical protein
MLGRAKSLERATPGGRSRTGGVDWHQGTLIANLGGAAMTPSEHYLQAERLLLEADDIARSSPEGADRLVARAHVHALLAGVRTAPPAPPRPADSGFDNRGRHNPPPAPRFGPGVDMFE